MIITYKVNHDQDKILKLYLFYLRKKLRKCPSWESTWELRNR